jgi:hypothetical protein
MLVVVQVGLIESPELVFLLEHADGDITVRHLLLHTIRSKTPIEQRLTMLRTDVPISRRVCLLAHALLSCV